MKMHIISTLVLGFVSVQSVEALTPSSAKAPDLSKMPAADVLKLGLIKPERIDGHCYHANIEFCQKGSDPNNCTDNEVLERQTNVQLDKLKFSLVKQSEGEKVPGTYLYQATPKSFFRTKNSLYTYRKTGKNAPLRLFVVLKETSCSVPEQETKDTRGAQPNISLSPSRTQEVPPVKNVAPPVLDKPSRAALEFLTNIPTKHDNNAKAGG